MGLLTSLLGASSATTSNTATGGTSQTGLLARHRRTVRQLVETPFQQGWQFRVEIDGQPSDFDVYVKDVTYGSFTIEYEATQVGTNTINAPLHKTAGTVTMTVRDHQDGRVEAFFTKLSKKVINDDGTINLPANYLVKMRLYLLSDDGAETLNKQWEVSVAECGEITRSRSALNEFVSFPIVLQKYRALSAKD